MKIISITGTKGKTTITRVMSYVLTKSGEDTLRVDTDGHYINEKQKSTLDDSKKMFSLVPTVCPGKYLITMKKYFPDFVAVLETAIGSSASAGLGYGLHQVGIFSNVLEDHLGSSSRLKTRMDIAEAKKFIFSRIDKNGYIVFNADDSYVCSQIKEAPEFREPIFLPVGLDFSHFDIKKHLENGGKCVTMEDGFVVMKSKDETKNIIAVNDIKWTFEGFFLPSVFSLMFICGGLYAVNGGVITERNLKALKKYQPDKFGGRLTLLENKEGVKVMVDYAHEKYSLREVAKLGHKLKGNKLIGVVRLAPDRPNDVIFETGQWIANDFDDLVVYDKIDGVTKMEYKGVKSNIYRGVGEVSKIFLEGILSNKKTGVVERVIVEEEAIKKAAKMAKRGDMVVVICGDDHKRTINYIKKHFKAKFV